MKIFISILLLLFISGKPVEFDLGLPEIQAVCKVTLNNGKIIEGFITFGTGGYDYMYRRHGFCRVHENGEREIIPYDFPFNLSSQYNYGNHQIGNKKLYYAENIPKGSGMGKNTKKEFNETQKTLTITKTDIEKYRLLDEMVMYKKIPLDLFLAYKENNESEKLTIKMNEIKSIELLKNPSKSSLDIIEKARIRQAESEKEDGYWVDYQPPAWYHEIITNQERIDYLSQYF